MAKTPLTSPRQAASFNCSKEVSMPHLSPPTLSHSEQKAILRATARNPRDHLIYSLALGTGLRLAEIVGLNVGDVYMLTRETKSYSRPSDICLANSAGLLAVRWMSGRPLRPQKAYDPELMVSSMLPPGKCALLLNSS
jgi:integrase